jgi:hypothetical protein
MSGAWVAGTTRSRALAKRRLGRVGARRLAALPSARAAIAAVAAGPYGHDVRAGDDLVTAQHAVGASLLWNLRVLAGWVPRDGVEALRTLAAWFEIDAIDGLVHALTAGDAHDAHDAPDPGPPPYRLGSLGTAWPHLWDATSLGDLRERLARSAWGDPGGDGPWEIQLAVRLAWALRVADEVPPARAWAAGGTALLVAREVVVPHRPLPDRLLPAAEALLAPGVTAAADVPAMAAALPRTAAWALAGVRLPADLWTAETAFWRRVEADGLRLARSPRFGLEPVVGTVAALAVDAWRVRGALTLAARGATAPEVLDALV